MDRIEIQQLIARYAYALDTGGRNGYDYADLFTPDGVFVGMNQGETGRLYRGRDTLAALARGGPRNPNYVSHYITNVVLEATPEGARGTAVRDHRRLSALTERQSAWTHGGIYEDTYVKTPDGWRFKTRVFYASEGGPTPKQLQNDPLKAPAAPTAAPGDPAPAAGGEAPGLRRLTAEDYIEIQQLVYTYPYALDTAANNGFDYADCSRPTVSSSARRPRGATTWPSWRSISRTAPNYVRHYLATSDRADRRRRRRQAVPRGARHRARPASRARSSSAATTRTSTRRPTPAGSSSAASSFRHGKRPRLRRRHSRAGRRRRYTPAGPTTDPSAGAAQSLGQRLS